MKPTQKPKIAFSLAEALVTLLIISIIAIASMPVITKKRRQVSEHGKWMCTLNSNYDYVEWDSKSDSVDIVNDPDSWRVVRGSKYSDIIYYKDPVTGVTRQKKRDRCIFYPPKAARNFNVTVIGGGGGGHDGDAVYKSYYTKSSSGSGTFIPKSEYNDMYDIILIGAGGGGGGGQNNGGSGGGGGGGAMFKGTVRLVNNGTYTFNIGAGGAKGYGEYHGGLSNSTSRRAAASGEESSFEGTVNGKTVSVRVPGGGGGDSVGCSKWKCRGGDAGAAGSSNDIRTSFSDTVRSVTKQSGTRGNSGGAYNCPNDISGGRNSFQSFQENSNKQPYILTYGSGGSGGRGCGYSNSGYNGSSGYLAISQTEQIHGLGGAAGKIDSKFIPSIEGHIAGSIPAPAEPNRSGGAVTAELYNNKTQNGVIKRAAGGAAGSTSYVAPANGEDSPWTYDGGGAASGSCSPVTNASAGTITEYQKVLKCEKAACVMDSADTVYLKEKNVTAGGAVAAPLGITPTWAVDNSAAAYAELLPSSPTATAVKTYLEALKIYYISSDEAMNKIDISNDYLSGYKNSYDFYYKGCFNDGDRLSYIKECITEKYETEAVQKQVEARRTQTCPDATKGKSFGAGGGGGRAGDLQGVFGKGGHGAAGAVIVEW